jgi:MFS family permease
MHTQRIESFQTIAISARKKEGLLPLWVALLAIGTGLLLLYPVMRLGYVYQINYSEGTNVYHAAEAMEGLTLYSNPLADPLTPVDYPPLSFFLVGITGNILGSYLIAGRFVALASLLFMTVLTPILLHQRGVHWKAGIFAGLAILALFAAYAPEYVGMNDPHCLGLVFTLLGVYLYVISGNNWLGLVLSSCAMMTGIFATQNTFPALLAVGLDIFFRSPRRGFFWLGLSLLLFYFLDFLSGYHFGRLFRGQFMFPVELSITSIMQQFSRFDIPFLFLVLTATWSALFAAFNSRLRVFSFYLGAAFLCSLYFSSGSAQGVSQFFDLFLAMGLLLGITLEQITEAFPSIPTLQKAFIWLIPPLLTLALLFHIPDRLPRENSENLLASIQTSFQQDAAYLRQQPGRVLCENLLLCYMAGKPLEMDLLAASELAIRGETTESLSLLMFEARQYSLIQLNRPLPDELAGAPYESTMRRFGSMTQNMRIAIARNYVKDRQLRSGVLYRARQ